MCRPEGNYTMDSTLTDTEIVAKTLEDKEFFGMLIERYEEKLRRYIRRITNVPPQDVDDLLQETFMKAYINLRSFDQSFSFSSWIYRIAHNTVISNYRRRSARPEDLILDNDEVYLQIADSINIEDQLITKEEAAYAARQMQDLRDEYREVLYLRFYEERSYDEISDILRKPPGTVATLINRAKKQLRTKVDTQS